MKIINIDYIDKKIRPQAFVSYFLLIGFTFVGFILRNAVILILPGVVACAIYLFLLGMRNKIYYFCGIACVCVIAYTVVEITDSMSSGTFITAIGLITLTPIRLTDEDRSEKLRELAKNDGKS